MAKHTHVFPFYTKPGTKPGYIDTSSDILVLRGIAMEKRHFDSTVPLFLDGKRVEGEVFYWHPIVQKTDFIEQGIWMVKEGLGFAKSRINQ